MWIIQLLKFLNMKNVILLIISIVLTVSCVSVKKQASNNVLLPPEKQTKTTEYNADNYHQPITSVLQITPDYKLPYFRPKEMGQSTMRISIVNDAIPTKVYSNIQCTEFVYPDSYLGQPKVISKIKIPGTTYILLNTIVQSAGLSTEELLMIDKSGKIYDVLIGKVMSNRGTVVKQFYVKKNGDIIVISIEPEDKGISLPLAEEFPDFHGTRIDRTYKAENGKFVLKNEKRYDPKIYSYQMLTDVSYDLWNGNETSGDKSEKPTSPETAEISMLTATELKRCHEENLSILRKLSDDEYIAGRMLPHYELNPDWNTLSCYTKGGISYAEVPVKSAYSMTKRNIFTGMDYELKCYSNLIFRKDTAGVTKECIRILIPDRENDSIPLLRKIKETDNGRYSGIKIYTDLNGRILHLERLDNGCLVRKASGRLKSQYIPVLGEIYFSNDYLQKRWWKLGTWKPSKDYIEW